MRHDVFISHSSKDATVAARVATVLEEAAIQCWMSPRDVPPGRPFSGEITRAVRASKCMVVILTGHSNASPNVLREIQLAVSNHVPIVEFRTEAVVLSDDLNFFLGIPHRIDAIDPPLKPHLAKLVAAVRQLRDNTSKAPQDKATSAEVSRERMSPAPALHGRSRHHVRNFAIVAVVGLCAALALKFVAEDRNRQNGHDAAAELNTVTSSAPHGGTPAAHLVAPSTTTTVTPTPTLGTAMTTPMASATATLTPTSTPTAMPTSPTRWTPSPTPTPAPTPERFISKFADPDEPFRVVSLRPRGKEKGFYWIVLINDTETTIVCNAVHPMGDEELVIPPGQQQFVRWLPFDEPVLRFVSSAAQLESDEKEWRPRLVAFRAANEQLLVKGFPVYRFSVNGFQRIVLRGGELMM